MPRSRGGDHHQQRQPPARPGERLCLSSSSGAGAGPPPPIPPGAAGAGGEQHRPRAPDGETRARAVAGKPNTVTSNPFACAEQGRRSARPGPTSAPPSTTASSGGDKPASPQGATIRRYRHIRRWSNESGRAMSPPRERYPSPTSIERCARAGASGGVAPGGSVVKVQTVRSRTAGGMDRWKVTSSRDRARVVAALAPQHVLLGQARAGRADHRHPGVDGRHPTRLRLRARDGDLHHPVADSDARPPARQVVQRPAQPT